MWGTTSRFRLRFWIWNFFWIFRKSFSKYFLEIKKETTGRSKIWGFWVMGLGFSLFTISYLAKWKLTEIPKQTKKDKILGFFMCCPTFSFLKIIENNRDQENWGGGSPLNDFSYFAFKMTIGLQGFRSWKICALADFGKKCFRPEISTPFYTLLKSKKGVMFFCKPSL